MDTTQVLMDRAYKKWTDGLSHDEFRATLDNEEKVAVHFGNLNYQVENGGFQQWYGNQFYTPEVMQYLMVMCRDVLPQNETIKIVSGMLLNVNKVLTEIKKSREVQNTYLSWDEEYSECKGEIDSLYKELEIYNNQYYDCNKVLLETVEIYLRNLTCE